MIWLRGLFGVALLLAIAALPKVALADAVQDCEKKSGDEAIRACTEAIKRSPKNSELFNNRGVVYRDKGDLDRAIADYNQAIALNPKDADAYFNRGRANLYNGALPKAQADLNQACA